MTAEGTFPKVDGDRLYASEVNKFNNQSKIHQIYTGTGFDSLTTSGTDEQSVELNSISPSDLKDYVKISMTLNTLGSGRYDSPNYLYGYVQLKIQSKEIGGPYSDSLSYTTIKKCEFRNGEKSESVQTINYIHTLSSGEKANGVQFKIYTKSVEEGSGMLDASAKNIQTVISNY